MARHCSALHAAQGALQPPPNSFADKAAAVAAAAVAVHIVSQD